MKRFNTWWGVHSNHVYGMAGVISLLVSIGVLFLPNSDTKVSDYFKNVKALELEDIAIPINTLRANQKNGLKNITLTNQGGYDINVWSDQYDYKLITFTFQDSHCKKALETISIVKKELSPYLSIQSYAIFGDSLQNDVKLKKFIDMYNLSVQGLYGSYKDIILMSKQMHLLLKNDKKEHFHSTDIADSHLQCIKLISGEVSRT